MTVSSYRVTGMTCAHCEAAVRAEVSQLTGVQSLQVSVETGDLTVESGSALNDAEVLAAVEEAGYEAVRVS